MIYISVSLISCFQENVMESKYLDEFETNETKKKHNFFECNMIVHDCEK